MTRPTSVRTGVLLSLTAAFLWGVSGAVAADAFSEVSPVRVSQVRAMLTALILIPIAVWRDAWRPYGMLGWYALLGVNLAVVNVTFYWAVNRLGVGPGATIQFLGPILVLVWMAVVQHRPVSGFAWAAAAVAIVGVGLVAQAWQLEGADWLGFVAGLASAITFASYLLLGEHLGHRAPIITVMTWGFVSAAVLWALVAPLWSFPTGLSNKVWLELLWVGILGTAVPFLAEFNALRRVAAGIVGIVATSEPVFGAAAAWVLLDQQLASVQILGGIMVIAAVASIQRWGLPEHEVPYEATR